MYVCSFFTNAGQTRCPLAISSEAVEAVETAVESNRVVEIAIEQNQAVVIAIEQNRAVEITVENTPAVEIAVEMISIEFQPLQPQISTAPFFQTLLPNSCHSTGLAYQPVDGWRYFTLLA